MKNTLFLSYVLSLIFMLTACSLNGNNQKDEALDMQIARLAEQSNNPRIAIKNYELALQSEPNSEVLQKKLVILYQQVGSNEKALKLLQKMLAEDKENTFAEYYYARSMQKIDLPNQAIEYYLLLKNNLYYEPKSLNNIAIILAQYGNQDLAQQCFYYGVINYPSNQTLPYNAALSVALNRGSEFPVTEKLTKQLKKTNDIEVLTLLSEEHPKTNLINNNQNRLAGKKQLSTLMIKSVKEWCEGA